MRASRANPPTDEATGETLWDEFKDSRWPRSHRVTLEHQGNTEGVLRPPQGARWAPECRYLAGGFPGLESSPIGTQFFTGNIGDMRFAKYR